jgi:hypothetical protein
MNEVAGIVKSFVWIFIDLAGSRIDGQCKGFSPGWLIFLLLKSKLK